MDKAVQTVAGGAGNFIVDAWIPILLNPHTWIAMLVSWALIESIKQFGFIHKRDEQSRKDISRIMSISIGYGCAYIAYDMFLGLEKAYILAITVGILNPWIYLLVGGFLARFEPPTQLLDFVKPHRRHKFVPLPKEHPDDMTTFTRIPEDKK